MLTIKEAAQKAGVHQESVRRWIREGKLPAALSARKKGYRIEEKDLDKFLDTKMEVKQRGKVEAEKVIRALAEAWDRTGDHGYIEIAYQIAEMSGLLNNFRQKWDEDDSFGTRAKRLREVVLHNLQKDIREETRQNELERLKKAEGELVLEEYLGDDKHFKRTV